MTAEQKIIEALRTWSPETKEEFINAVKAELITKGIGISSNTQDFFEAFKA